MDVSVIVPVYNDEKRIIECIASIQKQNADLKYEAIVIDDCSTDKTAAGLEKFKNIMLIRNNQRQGQSYSRNYGASLAKGKYLLFVDSDTVLSEDVISNAFSYMRNTDDQRIKGVQGAFKIHRQFPNRSSLLYNTLQYLLTESPQLSYSVNSACFFIEKDAFFSLGCFNEDIWYMEDTEFGRRAANNNVFFRRNIIFFKHFKQLTFPWLIKQHFMGGMQLAYLNRNFPVKNSSAKKYANPYFETDLKKTAALITVLIFSFFYPVILSAIPVILLTYAKTLRALYASSKDILYVIWGFFILNILPFVILAGLIFSRIFNININEGYRLFWLKSNLRLADV